MLKLLRSLLMGVGQCLAWGVGYMEHCAGSFLRGMWEAWSPPPAPPSDIDRVVEALERRAGGEQAVERAIAARPRREPVALGAQQREVQERALRYTTAVMYGQPRPTLDGLPEALAKRLGRLDSRVACAPVHRELVRATGRECRSGWWSNEPDEPGSAPPALPASAPRFA